MKISVVIPTHNPRPQYLARVIESLKLQTLDKHLWELLVVDNNSDSPVKETLDLSWHPRGCVVQEPQPGLTPARIRGINETEGQLIVFVDDDNVLKKDYLAGASHIAENLPWVGVFGGSVTADFEETPPRWTRHLWDLLAVRPCTETVWGNDRTQWDAFPCGAGMCLRREAARHYADNVVSHPLRLGLDRTGKQLLSGGDTDIVYNCLHHGFGMGRFKELELLHLIPRERLEPAYLLRLSEAIGYSNAILESLWPDTKKGQPPRGLRALAAAGIQALMREFQLHKFTRARQLGQARAQAYLQTVMREGNQAP